MGVKAEGTAGAEGAAGAEVEAKAAAKAEVVDSVEGKVPRSSRSEG